ncbi:hypothetical protein Glove_326g36 [Diversispora epigaea]|uniref:Uncharacterized protein n=1 Tax=Diversispora epigaea TaxID=1348612 RepID=A0A397HR37_9GLOM|nr:hypothetical protein Glove_326g36 [Diversispora epigaea]
MSSTYYDFRSDDGISDRSRPNRGIEPSPNDRCHNGYNNGLNGYSGHNGYNGITSTSSFNGRNHNNRSREDSRREDSRREDRREDSRREDRREDSRREDRREDRYHSKSKLSFLKFPKKMNPTNTKATKALKAGEYTQALKYLNELVRDYPDSYNVKCDRSEVHFHLGNQEKAAYDATSALKKNPEKSRAYYIRGFVFEKVERFNDALKDLNNGLARSPNDPYAFKALKICARLYYKSGDLDATIDKLNEALKLEPYDTWILQTRGEIYFDQRKYRKSLVDLKKLLEIESKNQTALILKGIIFKKSERYNEALTDFNKALIADPMNSKLLINRVKVLLILGKYNEAQLDIEKLIKNEEGTKLLKNEGSNLNKAKILKLRGIMFKGLGRFKEAREDFTKALEIKEKASTYRYRSQIHVVLKNLDAALNDLNAALELDHNDKEADTLRNKVLSQLKKFNEALTGLNKTLVSNPYDISALTERGCVYLSMKRYDEALTDLNRALQSQPKTVRALLIRAKVYRIRNDFSLSLEDLNTALQVEPRNAQLVRNIGKVYTLKNDHDKAISNLERSISIEPHASALRYRGISNSKLGNYQNSIKDFNQVLIMKPSNSNVYYDRGETYYKLSNYSESLGDLNKSLEYDENINSHKLRAKVYEQLKEYEKSRNDLDHVIDAFPTDTKSIFSRAQMNENLKKYQDSISDLSKVITIEKHLNNNNNINNNNNNNNSIHKAAVKFRGKLFMKLSRYEEALKDFNELLEIDENDIEAIGLRAEVYQLLENDTLALVDLDNGIKNKQGNKCWLFVIRGGIYRNQKKFDEALEDLNKVMIINKFLSTEENNSGNKRGKEEKIENSNSYDLKAHATALCYRGSIMRELNKAEEALHDLNESLRIEPFNPLALCERSSIFRDSGRYDQAWEDLETILDGEEDDDDDE